MEYDNILVQEGAGVEGFEDYLKGFFLSLAIGLAILNDKFKLACVMEGIMG